jgi:hypothetical protein
LRSSAMAPAIFLSPRRWLGAHWPSPFTTTWTRQRSTWSAIPCAKPWPESCEIRPARQSDAATDSEAGSGIRDSATIRTKSRTLILGARSRIWAYPTKVLCLSGPVEQAYQFDRSPSLMYNPICSQETVRGSGFPTGHLASRPWTLVSAERVRGHTRVRTRSLGKRRKTW